MTTMKVSDIWGELSLQLPTHDGLLLRRCPTTIVPNIYVAVTSPGSFRCLAVSITDVALKIDVSGFSNLRDIEVEVSDSGPNRGERFLVFKLLESHLNDIFGVLCDDLITSVADVRDDASLIRELLDRFEQWKTLFDRASLSGLSREEQRGLWGELSFLRKAIVRGFNPLSVLSAWFGPSGGIRDYQNGSIALEVKSTIATGLQRIRISNERQLDPSSLEGLFLYLLSLEPIAGTGSTLNDLVDDIDALLNQTESNRFKTKLFECGYFEHDREIYEELGYQIHDETYYEIRDNFPRIEEADLRAGVGNVKYSITVAGYEGYSVSENTVFEKMNFS